MAEKHKKTPVDPAAKPEPQSKAAPKAAMNTAQPAPATASKSTATKSSAIKKGGSAAETKSTPSKSPAAKVATNAAASKAAATKSNTFSQMKTASAKIASLKAAQAHSQKAGPALKGKPPVNPVPFAATVSKPVAAAPARAVPAAVSKPASQKITAAVQAAPAVSTPKALAEKAAAARGAMAAQKKPVLARHGFKTNEFVVYPAHGVGRIVGIEEQEIAGMSLELFVITFDKEKLTLRVPTGKLASIGMRKLAEETVVKRAMETLKGRARVKRTMWSRRAQEYVAKINSGDLISIAEVVRDLYRSEAQPEQSYSERQLYENALERMAREIAAVEKLDERGAVQRIVEILSKSAKGRRLAAETAEAAESADDIKAA